MLRWMWLLTAQETHESIIYAASRHEAILELARRARSWRGGTNLVVLETVEAPDAASMWCARCRTWHALPWCITSSSP